MKHIAHFFRNLTSLARGKSRRITALKGLPETVKIILERRSCRSFADEPVTDADMDIILEAGRFAPSTVNLQTWSFISFSKSRWRGLFERSIPFNGDRAVFVCADTHRLQALFADFQDSPHLSLTFAAFNAGLAAMNMTIAAESLGICSIMLSETGRTGLLDYAYLKEKLRLPEGVLPITTLVLGRSAQKSAGVPPRQPWNAVVMNGAYMSADEQALRDWLAQMHIGYKITHPLSRFDRQLSLYKNKMHDAEKMLREQFRRI